ncbi:MAG: glycosyltransferase [Pirellulaceae bacterium]
MNKLLFVTPEIGWPPSTGGHIRQWNTLQALKRCGNLDVIAFQLPDRPVPDELYKGCQRVVAIDRQWLEWTPAQRLSYATTRGRLRMTIGTVKPFEFTGPRNQELAKWFSQAVHHEAYDVIWIAKAVTAVALGWRDPVRTILDGDDFDSVREYHLLRTTPWYGAKLCNYVNLIKLASWERLLPRWFAHVARCSEADRRRHPARNVVVIPNGTQLPSLDRDDRPANRILFVGTMGYEPNRNGMEWFLDQIWPRIRQTVPSAELDIVGAQPSERVLSHNGRDGTQVHGFVESVAPFWRSAALSVAPLLAGAGTRLKILESLANSVPVVSTSIGAFGLDLGVEEGVLRADDPQCFAERCVELLRNIPAGRALGLRGRQAVAAQYDWSNIQTQIQELVHKVAAQQKPANGNSRPEHEGRGRIPPVEVT